MTDTTATTDNLAPRDLRLLLEIDRLCGDGGPSIDSPEAQVSWLVAGLKGLAVRIRATPAPDRDLVARAIDDEIWDSDGDYPLDRRRIAERREKAYAKADQIIALMQGE